jgi:hypothetical protein
LQNKTINRILKRGAAALHRHKSSSKELKRFEEIYTTVYRHARKKGQSHKDALKYCWNVYSSQAPDTERSIIKKVTGPKMKLNKQNLRQMIIREMLEGDVINMSDFKQKTIEPDPVVGAEQRSYESFLSEIHTQLIDFMNDDFESLSSDQQVFIDSVLDMIEDELGMDNEEEIDFGEDDDMPPDESEEYDEDEEEDF